MEIIRLPKQTWTNEMEEKIKYLYVELGYTLKDISKLCGTKPETIGQKLRLHGIDTAKNKGRSKNRKLLHNYFDNIDTEGKAYFLGLILADGSIVWDSAGERNPTIAIELIESDAEILYSFGEEIRYEGTLYKNKRENRKNGTIRISFRSLDVALALKKYKIVANKTYDIENFSLDFIPSNLRRHFLRGFTDGDGSIYFSNGTVHLSYTGYSKDLIQTIKTASFYEIGEKETGVITKYNNVHKFTFNGGKAKKLLKHLYTDSNYYIQRKFDLFNKCMI